MVPITANKRTNVILMRRVKLTCGEDDMQINCTECGGKSIIRNTVKLDPKMSKLYCICKNPHCGHTFVMDLCFSHTLSPSSNQAKDLVANLLRALPEHERQLMLASL